MTDNRLRWGALAWLLTLQFFVVETAVELQQEGGYSRVEDVISALGASTSTAAQLMNASFVLQGALIVAGALALQPVLRTTAGRTAQVLLGAAGVGSLLVGVFPLDGNAAAHQTGAGLYLVGGALGLVALAYAIRRRSEALGTALALLGVVGAAGTVFFAAGITGYLGVGGTERVAAYVLPIGLALAGGSLWRLGSAASGDRADDRAEHRGRARAKDERRRAREEKAARDRERDAALEAAARRRDDRSPGFADPDAAGEQDDPEDLWSARVRRGD